MIRWPFRKRRVWGCDQRIVVMTDAGTQMDTTCKNAKLLVELAGWSERASRTTLIDLRSPKAIEPREVRNARAQDPLP